MSDVRAGDPKVSDEEWNAYLKGYAAGRRDEREACAVVADGYEEAFENAASAIAKDIRARPSFTSTPPPSTADQAGPARP